MKWNSRVRNYLANSREKNSFENNYFSLKNGKRLLLSRFDGQERYLSKQSSSADLKEAFRDLLSQAYEIGKSDGRLEKEKELRESLGKSINTLKNFLNFT